MDPFDSSRTLPAVSGSLTCGNLLHCSGCGTVILDRFYLKALDKLWHEDCLKCACCDCRLGEVGSTCFTKADLILCRRDYLRLFGGVGHCSSCKKQIPAFELVMRANGNVYHLECFNCHNCSYRFCVGDRFYLWNNQILCEMDYEDRMLSGLSQRSLQNGNIPSIRSCMPHSVIVPNSTHLTCVVNEPSEMNRSGTI
ncbi:LIM domain only protein 3-like isoform X2 [Paramacrobiotus metropolitanus]|nr:LIM domain only protein 3-like isoform X2 [Paramacrobiotus metropolitanus]XP_055342791.1 LIM domain only protein 3-like isoform X2 [Paramacrobiotus metropolitanus]